ncbi:MAG TPA: class I SAM-dependent methyltransferase [Candidatus Acidoferrum sp.]|nr:class I SAM-dependent methyltransferase [Candidatus Acidoferrum sp.]
MSRTPVRTPSATGQQSMTHFSGDVNDAVERALKLAHGVPGFLGDNEARFLAMLAVCTPADGLIVEIGSFKGKSTVLLASVAVHRGLGRIVAIDPHTSPSPTDPGLPPGASSFEEFNAALRSANLEEQVEVHRTFSREVAKDWNRPIRLLWIDGEHTYKGAKEDFEMFSPFLANGGVVALHDALHAFEGPLRVFVEDILRSDRFGAAGFAQSIAWGQFRPHDGAEFRGDRERLAHRAEKLLPFLKDSAPIRGFKKIRYKLARSRVPRAPLSAAVWLSLISGRTAR